MNNEIPKVIRLSRLKLHVRFPVLEEPRSMTERELTDLVSYIQKMSNEKYQFVFMTPDHCEIIPEEGK